VKIELDKIKTKGKRGRCDLELKLCIGCKIKMEKWFARFPWYMQDVEVVEEVA
jgi:hypothetical protein